MIEAVLNGAERNGGGDFDDFYRHGAGIVC
jgi:hypothetical protein